MTSLPFDKPGAFLRGNLHSHSTVSDGHLSPEQVCAHYRRAGYDFLALTDHFLERYGYPVTDTCPYRIDGFTTLLGAELHAGRTEFGLLWHILAVGLPHGFAPAGPQETGPEITARALEAGAFVAAAHPAWYGITEADILSLGEIHAIEIYNGTAADHNDKPDSLYMLDLLLMRGRRYSACATDDAHFNPDRHDSLRGWVWVKSQHREPEAILQALKAGHYYSSTGPQIHDIRLLPGRKFEIRCSPVERIFVTGYGHSADSAWGNGIISAELSLDNLPHSPYFRVTVRDSHGGRAWTNPIWL